MITLIEVLKECRNYFARTVETGAYEIKDGTITLKGDYIPAQYLRLCGSYLNDGVYRIEEVNGKTISFIQSDSDYPLWAQPTNVQNAYSKGDKVTHDGLRYTSLIDANTTVPGANEDRYWLYVPGIDLENPLTDETFDGKVYGLAIPADFLSLVRDISKFEQMQKANPRSTIVASESRQSGSITYQTGANGRAVTWQDTFGAKLNKYRRMRDTPERVKKI